MRGSAWIVAAILVAAAVVAVIPANRVPPAGPSPVPVAIGGPHLMPPDVRTGMRPPADALAVGPIDPSASAVGEARVLVLLIEFTDVLHDPAHDAGFFDRLFNDASPGALSMHAFYAQASYGALSINATIVPTWFVSNRTMAYYGQDGLSAVDSANGPIYNLVTEAVRAADPVVNFSAFDSDGDGVVDHLMIVHAGPAQEEHANQTDLIWSHSWAVASPSLIVDGVQVYKYTMISEDSPVGVPVHEFGHDLGLPDLYDTDYSSDGAGIWDPMSEGPWNGEPHGSSPAMFSAWSKVQLGWLTPTPGPLAFAAGAAIPAAETRAFAYRLSVPGSPLEYFLVENREPISFDAALPAYGLLIWHVDDSQRDNTVDTHRLLDLQEADEGVNGDHPTDAGDPWHDSIIGFGPDTDPGSVAYRGTPTTWRVRDISAIGDPMTASILNAVPTDIAVREIRVPASVALGGSVTAHVVIRNEGLSTAATALSVRVYRDALSPAALVIQRNGTLTVPSGGVVVANVTFSATTLARYLIDAASTTSGDTIASDDERVAHVSTNVFAFRDDVESGVSNWTLRGTSLDNPQWAILNASAANGSAHGGSFAWRFGYTMNDTVSPTNPAWRTITSPVVNLTGPAYLVFYQRYDVSNATQGQSPGSARATVEVRYAGGNWSVVAAVAGRSLQWDGVSIPLTPPRLPTTVEVRLNATSGDMPARGGWWIDDVAIAARGLAHGVVLLPSTQHVAAIAGTLATAVVKIVNVGDYRDSFVVNASVVSGWGSAFAPPGGVLPTLPDRTIALAPDRDAVVALAILIPPGTAGGLYPAAVLANGPANASAALGIAVTALPGSNGIFILVMGVAALAGGAVAVVGFLLWRRRERRPRP